GMQGLGRDSFTRFRIYPQAPFLHPGRPPELVTISTPCGLVGPGPSDHRLYVANPVGKRAPYGIATGPYGTPHLTLPPWRGPILPPVQPAPTGISITSRRARRNSSRPIASPSSPSSWTYGRAISAGRS